MAVREINPHQLIGPRLDGLNVAPLGEHDVPQQLVEQFLRLLLFAPRERLQKGALQAKGIRPASPRSRLSS